MTDQAFVTLERNIILYICNDAIKNIDANQNYLLRVHDDTIKRREDRWAKSWFTRCFTPRPSDPPEGRLEAGTRDEDMRQLAYNIKNALGDGTTRATVSIGVNTLAKLRQLAGR